MMDKSTMDGTPESAQSPITMNDIALRCGVSKMTVSRILRGQSGRSKKAEEIRAVAKAMGYDPALHDSARRLALRKGGQRLLNQTLGCILPFDFFSATFFSELYRGILKGATEYNFSLLTAQVFMERQRKPSQLPASFRRGEVDGIITFGNTSLLRPVLPQLVGLYSGRNFPLITLLSTHKGFASVCADEYFGAYQAAEHLLHLGHRHIVQFTYWQYEAPQTPVQSERTTATCDAMRAHGLDPEVYLHLLPYERHSLNPRNMSNELSALPTRRQRSVISRYPFLQYLTEHQNVTAILALNDANALHAWYLLHHAGYSVPEDISIIGFDDTDPMINTYGRNVLSTIHMPLLDIGYEAVRSCLDQVTGVRICDECMRLPTTFIDRGSTAVPAIL